MTNNKTRWTSVPCSDWQTATAPNGDDVLLDISRGRHWLCLVDPDDREVRYRSLEEGNFLVFDPDDQTISIDVPVGLGVGDADYIATEAVKDCDDPEDIAQSIREAFAGLGDWQLWVDVSEGDWTSCTAWTDEDTAAHAPGGVQALEEVLIERAAECMVIFHYHSAAHCLHEEWSEAEEVRTSR